MSGRWHVCLTGWQKVAWALDEDLRWVKRSLDSSCKWSSLPSARIVHAAWPAAVNAIPAGALRGKAVVCQADNPPAFYLGTDGFAEAAARVDLWIARSNEASAQFRCLGLPAAKVPYCVDPAIFRRLPGGKDSGRRSLGIAPDALVIGNFHRDSEGADLTRPKKQKGPEVFLEIAKTLNRRIPHLVVLLAGPRRHWLLRSLRAEGINVVFSGQEPGDDDDYERNILTRERLNELYQALDVCVISSRWEGGPYSVLEALAAGTAVLSSPVGTARDVLPSECLYETVEEAADLLEQHARDGFLSTPCTQASESASHTHSPEALRQSLLEAYRTLPTGAVPAREMVDSVWGLLAGRVRRSNHTSSRRIAEMTGNVRERAERGGQSNDLINYRDDGTVESLLACASRIAAARIG